MLLGAPGGRAADKYRVYLGTAGTLENEGVFRSVLDVRTGQLSQPELAVAALRPGVITIHPAGTHLYTIGKPAGYKGPRSGSVCAYKIDRDSGSLTLLNYEETKGQGPCYLQIDHQRRNILVCHYMSGNISVLPIAADGSVRPVSCVQQHSGSSQNPIRQDRPHPHSVTLDAADRYAFVTDLGLDRIVIYRYDSAKGKLIPSNSRYVATRPGSGPRHFVFGPGERFAYANLELTSEVTVFRHDAEHGSLQPVQTISTLPDDYAGRNANAGIRITPDGRFLYVTNRGHNSVAMFAVDSKSGRLTWLGSAATPGEVPQSLAIDPTGRWLIATDMRSGHARVFKINKETGRLTHACTITVPKVNTVVFQPLD